MRYSVGELAYDCSSCLLILIRSWFTDKITRISDFGHFWLSKYFRCYTTCPLKSSEVSISVPTRQRKGHKIGRYLQQKSKSFYFSNLHYVAWIMSVDNIWECVMKYKGNLEDNNNGRIAYTPGRILMNFKTKFVGVLK